MNIHLVCVPVAVATAIFLSSAVARAETVTLGVPDEGTVWREAQPTYEFKHPMRVTCEEFLDADAIYRPYVVAWLSGRTIGVLDIENPDEFVPVSVPQIVTLCKEEPDEMVWELVRTQ